MGEDKMVLTEQENRVVFLAGLAEKSGNPFFHHGVYRGKIVDDMLVFNSSIFLSINKDQCNSLVKKLQEKGILRIQVGPERASTYANYYYYVADSAGKEKAWERIGNTVLKDAFSLLSENIVLMETLGCALVYRYKGWRYINEERISIDPEGLNVLVKNCILMKNRYVYTGTASGINYFIPHTPFCKLLDYLNREFLAFFFKKLESSGIGVAENYEDVREGILSDPHFGKLGLDSYDARVVDYIFDLAKSLQISMPICYRQLYDRFKESVVSPKVLEKMPYLLRGSIETLEDSISHYKRGTFSDFRLALISVDNAIELILKNHVLGKDMSVEDVRRISFDSLLKKCRSIRIVAEKTANFKQIHAARNQLYHMPLGIVDKLILKDAIDLTKHLFEEEAGEELRIKL